MKMNLLALTLAAAFGWSSSVLAADEVVRDKEKAAEPAKAKKPAKKKVKPHSHPEAKGLPVREKAERSGDNQKPLHQHQKDHK